MLKKVFQELDDWISDINDERRREGGVTVGKCYIKVLGQLALIEAKLGLALAATQDVDALTNASSEVMNALNSILKKYRKHWDANSHEIWMPTETKYHLIHSGINVKGEVAQPEYVILSKALKAPAKNKSLMIEYLAKGPSPLFMNLAKKYKLNLDSFVL